jgi:cell division protein FtsB
MNTPQASTFFTPAASFLPSSPAPSSSSDEHEAGPSRKRARTDMTPEQRKEARAHRNRIAAQNSRDKRKAEFSTLHQRVAELEAENARLRAGAHVVVAPATAATPLSPEQSQWEAENAALKERIRTLEKGWDVILKALAAQGLPTALFAPDAVPSTQPAPATQSISATTSSPVVVPASPVYPPTPVSLSPSFVSPSPAFAAPELPESARHPARVATVALPATSLQRADLTSRCRSRPPAHSRRTTVLRALRRLRMTRAWPTSSPGSALRPSRRR